MWFVSVAYNIRRGGFGVGLPVPETSFEKLGPMYFTAFHCIFILIASQEISHWSTSIPFIVMRCSFT